MNKLVLCTTGTSIANGTPSLREVQNIKTAWNDNLKEFEKEIDDKLKTLNLNDNKVIRALSAELNTLDRIGIKSGDKIVLLATDSAAGRICCEANKKIIEDIYNVDVEIKRIEGLQVFDAKLLREKGLKNLVKVVLDEYLTNDNIRYLYDIIINPTGGYKGIVPFLTVLGMMYGKYSVYLFEFSNELIKLPPLPLTFDIDKYERVKDALKYMEENIAIREEEYFSKIIGFDESERDLFLSFTEPFDEFTITLSPLAYILLKIDESIYEVKISKSALEKVENLNGQKRVVIERLITNSANPLWREQNLHRWKNSDFLIIKQGNTAERLAGFMKNNIFHIALAFPNHDEYEKELGKYKVSDFSNEEFVEWIPKQDEKDISTYDKLVREYDNLNLEKEELNLELNNIQTKLDEVKKEIFSTKQEKELCVEENQQLIDKLNQLKIDNKKYFTQYSELLQQQKVLENEIKDIENLKEEFKNEKNRFQLENKSLQEEILSLKAIQETQKDELNRYKNLSFIEKLKFLFK